MCFHKGLELADPSFTASSPSGLDRLTRLDQAMSLGDGKMHLGARLERLIWLFFSRPANAWLLNVGREGERK